MRYEIRKLDTISISKRPNATTSANSLKGRANRVKITKNAPNITLRRLLHKRMSFHVSIFLVREHFKYTLTTKHWVLETHHSRKIPRNPNPKKENLHDPSELHKIERRPPLLPMIGINFQWKKELSQKEITKDVDTSLSLVSWIITKSNKLAVINFLTLNYLTMLQIPQTLKDPLNIESDSYLFAHLFAGDLFSPNQLI